MRRYHMMEIPSPWQKFLLFACQDQHLPIHCDLFSESMLPLSSYFSHPRLQVSRNASGFYFFPCDIRVAYVVLKTSQLMLLWKQMVRERSWKTIQAWWANTRDLFLLNMVNLLGQKLWGREG